MVYPQTHDDLQAIVEQYEQTGQYNAVHLTEEGEIKGVNYADEVVHIFLKDPTYVEGSLGKDFYVVLYLQHDTVKAFMGSQVTAKEHMDYKLDVLKNFVKKAGFDGISQVSTNWTIDRPVEIIDVEAIRDEYASKGFEVGEIGADSFSLAVAESHPKYNELGPKYGTIVFSPKGLTLHVFDDLYHKGHSPMTLLKGVMQKLDLEDCYYSCIP